MWIILCDVTSVNARFQKVLRFRVSNRPVGAPSAAGASSVRVRVLRVGPAHRGRRRGEQVPHGDGVLPRWCLCWCCGSYWFRIHWFLASSFMTSVGATVCLLLVASESRRRKNQMKSEIHPRLQASQCVEKKNWRFVRKRFILEFGCVNQLCISYS